MPPETDGDVAVVRPYYATEEAYKMGYNRFADVDDETVPDDDEFTLAPFRSSATWAHTVLPKLRAMAGFADAGHGTYQCHRQVAAIHEGCEEDTPAEADLVDARRVLDALTEAFDAGAYDAAEGNEGDPGDYW